MKRVFSIIESSDAARQDFARALLTRGIEAESFGSVDEFVRNFEPERSHALMVDINGASGHGLDLLSKLKKERVPVATIAAISGDSPRLVLDAFHAGAYDCVLKPIDAASLCETVEQALEQGDRRYASSLFELKMARALESLSTGEADVLECLIRGYANKKTAERLKIGLRTVEARRARILRKIDVANLSELVQKVVLFRAQTGPQAGERI